MNDAEVLRFFQQLIEGSFIVPNRNVMLLPRGYETPSAMRIRWQATGDYPNVGLRLFIRSKNTGVSLRLGEVVNAINFVEGRVAGDLHFMNNIKHNSRLLKRSFLEEAIAPWKLLDLVKPLRNQNSILETWVYGTSKVLHTIIKGKEEKHLVFTDLSPYENKKS